MVLISVAVLGLFISSQILRAETLNWVGCGITKKAFMAELARAYTSKTGVKINIDGGGATKGIRMVANHSAHIGGSCRSVLNGLPQEKAAKQTPVAWDALVVIVNKNNPVDNITLQQLKDIYTGKITNWKVLGGADRPIGVYARQGKLSGVGRMLRELVFANYDQEFSATYQVKSSEPLEKGIEKSLYAIGVTGVSSAQRRDVKILKLDGVKPSLKNIVSSKYMLYRPLYLITHVDASNSVVNDFVKYALSREGSQVIRDAGSIPDSDAMVLIMKKIDQYQGANRQGLKDKGEWNPNIQQY